jgi:hypothetical protein
MIGHTLRNLLQDRNKTWNYPGRPLKRKAEKGLDG